MRAHQLSLLLVALSLLASPALAQIVVATSDLNLRSGQSTHSVIKAKLLKGDTADLVPPTIKRLGYYHVRTRATPSVTGWSWAQRLRLVSAQPSPAPTPTPPTPPPAGGITNAIDSLWPKTPSNAADIHWPDGNHALCPADGVGGDAATNAFKNRSDEPASYHEVTWDAVATLPFPHNQRRQRTGDANPWPSLDLKALALDEGVPISVVGFLSGIREEGQETTNCGQSAHPRVDWHMYLTRAPHQKTRQAIVVETTPRVRPNHPGWTIPAITELVTNGDSVRISGWLMFDPQHWDQMWEYLSPSDTTGIKARITLWEIHPITKIEVRRNGSWQSLDQP